MSSREAKYRVGQRVMFTSYETEDKDISLSGTIKSVIHEYKTDVVYNIDDYMVAESEIQWLIADQDQDMPSCEEAGTW